MHTAITECVLEYMKMLGRPVSLAELRSSVQLRDICLRKATSSCSSGTVEQELAAGVSRLPGDWRLVPVHVSRTATHYEVMFIQYTLYEQILNTYQLIVSDCYTHASVKGYNNDSTCT